MHCWDEFPAVFKNYCKHSLPVLSLQKTIKKANILIGDKHSTFEPLKIVRSQFEVKFSELIRIIKLENTLYKITRHFPHRS